MVDNQPPLVGRSPRLNNRLLECFDSSPILLFHFPSFAASSCLCCSCCSCCSCCCCCCCCSSSCRLVLQYLATIDGDFRLKIIIYQMSEETGQDLSRMEQSAVASISASVSSSGSAQTSAASSSSPGKETQLVLSSSSSTSIGGSRSSLHPPLSSSPSKASAPKSEAVFAAASNTAYKSLSSSFHPSPSLQKNVSCSTIITTSFSSNASTVSSGPSTIIGEVATEIQVKSSHDIDKNSSRCHLSTNSSQSSTTLSTTNLSLPSANLSTMETPITTESIQTSASSRTGVVATTGSVDCCDDDAASSVRQNDVLVQHQQRFQQAVTSGMAQQASGCFNVQMNSDPAHGALQQTTTMQGVLQQTVVVSDNVSVQQRVAVAQETVSQQIVRPVSTAAAIAQVAGAEQQQQQQTPAQPQQTAGFQLHQPVGNTLATQPTFQLANLGQSLIAPQNFQSLVAQPGTIFNGTQIFCTPDLTRSQQIDVPSMGCQQFLAAPTNAFAGGHVVSGVPQVQLVQTGPNQFIQQQCLQQQFMFQSMPGLQNNGVTIQQHQTTQQQQQASITNFQQQQQTQQQTQQAEGSTKTQTILPATSSQQQPQQNLSCMQQPQQQNAPHQNMSMIRLAVSGSYAIPQQAQQPQALSVKGLATVLPQQTNMNICNNNNNINQKQLLQKQPQQPLLFGTIGMLQNQTIQQQPQQPTIYQQQRPLNLGSMGQAAQFTIGNNGALRFAHGPSFITNTGQLLSTNQTLLNLGQIQVPLMNQQLLVTPQGGGTTTLLGSQPLYIRTADAFSTQQGVVGNVQQLQPIQQVKNIANIAPQTAAVINQVNPQPRRGDKNGGGSSASQQSAGKSSHKSGSNKLQSIAKSNSLTSSSMMASSSATGVASTNIQAQQNATSNSGTTTAASALQNDPSAPSSLPSAIGQGKLDRSSVAIPNDRSPSVRVQDNPAASRPHPAVIVVQPKQQQQQQPFEEKRQIEKMEVDGNSACTNGKHQEKDKNFTAFPSPNPSTQGNMAIEESSEEGRNGNVQQAVLPLKEEDQDEHRLVIVEETSDRSPAKTFGKTEKKKRKRSSKPKVLTHIIEGFIIQEATEPFPVNRTPVSNQFLSSSLKSSSLESLIKDSATSNRSGNRLEDSSTEEEDNNNNDDDDETEDESVPASKKIKLGEQEVKQVPGDNNTPANASNDNAVDIRPGAVAREGHEIPSNVGQQIQLAPMNLSSSQPPRQHVATSVKHVLPPQTTTSSQQRLAPLNKGQTNTQDRSSATHLICEFCGEMGLAENFPCSKRFCSVSCSKRFSAHSNKFKQAAEHGHGSSGTDAKQVSMMSVIKGSKRPLGQPKSHQQGTTSDRGPTTATVAASIHIPAPVAPSIPVGNNNMLLTASNLQQFDHNLQQPQQHLSYSMPTTAVTPNKQTQLQNPGNASPGAKQQPAGNAAGDDLAGVHCPDKPLSQWSVNDVYDFVASLPGCGTYAQEFRQQEIDGSALGLLKEDHLMTTLNVKLGPALKICAVVNSLKTE